MQQIYDLIVIGAGPAGMAAAISGAANGQNVVILEAGEAGGHLNELEEIHDYPGFPEISGADLVSMLKEHLDYHSVEIIQAEATGLDASDVIKSVWCRKTEYAATAIVIATGAPKPNVLLSGIDCDSHGNIISGEDCRTSLPCVYAAGNARTRVSTAILNDMADGASSIQSFLEDII